MTLCPHCNENEIEYHKSLVFLSDNTWTRWHSLSHVNTNDSGEKGYCEFYNIDIKEFFVNKDKIIPNNFACIYCVFKLRMLEK